MIITGCQRSGTKSAAKIFGIGHEVQFNPNTDFNRLNGNLNDLNSTIFNLKPEASWLAAPFVPVLKARFPIIHLIRHPLAVINSMLGIGFWLREKDQGYIEGHEPYRNFALRFCPKIEEAEGNPVNLSMHYYIFWNRMIHEVTNNPTSHIPISYPPRIRIESIQSAPVLNKRKRGDIQSWDDLPDCPLLEELKELAGEYEYE